MLEVIEITVCLLALDVLQWVAFVFFLLDKKNLEELYELGSFLAAYGY